MAREYRKGNWSLEESLILVRAKKLDDERRLKTGRNSGSGGGELRWKWVENCCWTHGCFRSQNQCNDKWDNLLRDYKKVRDYQAISHASNDQFQFPSYWTIDKHQRKHRKLPSNMLPQLFQAVTQVLQTKSHSLTLATQPPPLPLPLPQPPPPPHPPPPVSAKSIVIIYEMDVVEGSESSGTESNEEDDNNLESKRRKSEKLGCSIMRSASELAQALGSSEEKKEKRHREMMKLQHRRLQMEETRNQMNQQSFTNLVAAVTNLSCAIQSLINSMTRDIGRDDDGEGHADASLF
ncbi:Trihelix transcription factor ASR3, partial [Mucuna pruriens]